MEAIYERQHRTLAALNVDLIRHLWDALAVPTNLYLQSELGVGGRGADLLANIQSAMSMLNFYVNRAGRYLSPERRRILERAKGELRIAFRRTPGP
jgi:hypothetical protein